MDRSVNRGEILSDHQLPARSQIVQQCLAEAGLTASVRELPDSARTAAEAAALNCAVGAIASSLVFLADDEPLLVMTGGRHRVDTGLLAVHTGAAKIEMATARQVRAITGQAIGGVAPVGQPEAVRDVRYTRHKESARNAPFTGECTAPIYVWQGQLYYPVNAD